MDKEPAEQEPKGKKKDKRIAKEMRLCRCEITEMELRDAAEEMARRVADRGAAQQEFDTVKTQFKSRLEAAQNDIERCARLIRDKAEHRPVECRVIYDYAAGQVEVFRTDTDETIEKRRMRLDERQDALPLE